MATAVPSKEAKSYLPAVKSGSVGSLNPIEIAYVARAATLNGFGTLDYEI